MAAADHEPSSTSRYRDVEVEVLPLGGELAWVRALHRGDASVRETHTVELLRRCSRFATLEEHARDRCDELSLDPAMAEAMQDELAELVRAGLLVAESSLAVPEPDELGAAAPAIGAICWPTKDRRSVLERGVASFAEHCRRHGRSPDLVVSDDTVDVAEGRAIRGTLDGVATKFGLTARYGGLEQRRRFAEAVAARAGVEPEVVRFALFGLDPWHHRYGANRNALLLDSIGDLILSADDDVVCRVAQAANRAEGLTLSSAPQPQDFFFFGDRAAAVGATTEVDRDLLGLHERLLGRGVRGAVAAHRDEGLHLDDMAASFVGALAGRGGRTILTVQGMVGDSGLGPDVPFYAVTDETRSRILADRETYRASCGTREILRAVRRPTIGQTSNCVATTVGIDNRELAAPFLPVLPSEDSVFGTVLRKSHPDGYHAFLPWVLTHAPSGTRTVDLAAAMQRSNALYAVQVVERCVDLAPLGPAQRSTADRLVAIGRSLSEIGGLPGDEFLDWVRFERSRMLSEQVVFWEALLEQYPEPDTWVEDVRGRIESTRSSLAAAEFLEVGDPGVDPGLESAGERTRQLVGAYGRLLQAWPAIVEAARALRSSGHRLTEPAGRKAQR